MTTSDSDSDDSSDASTVTLPARNNKLTQEIAPAGPLKDESKATIHENEANDVQLQPGAEVTGGYQDVGHQESECTWQRSPGGNPSNEVKLQRTSKAPEKPSTQDELACTLDYASHETDVLDMESLETGTASKPI
jgi:hypothetical protein